MKLSWNAFTVITMNQFWILMNYFTVLDVWILIHPTVRPVWLRLVPYSLCGQRADGPKTSLYQDCNQSKTTWIQVHNWDQNQPKEKIKPAGPSLKPKLENKRRLKPVKPKSSTRTNNSQKPRLKPPKKQLNPGLETGIKPAKPVQNQSKTSWNHHHHSRKQPRAEPIQKPIQKPLSSEL